MGAISAGTACRTSGCAAGVMTGFDVAAAMELGPKGKAISIIGCAMVGDAVGNEAGKGAESPE